MPSSFFTNPSTETIRSRSIGKCASASTRTGPGSKSRTKVWHASAGLPSIIIPQLPQIAMRHDQRKLKVPSISSLMCSSACSSDMSSLHGTVYSCQTGASSCPAR